MSYIIFAYKVTTNNRRALIESAPEWVNTEHYNIEARTELQDVTKDQMRSMMRSLLEDRFQLVVHYSTRETPVLQRNWFIQGTWGHNSGCILIHAVHAGSDFTNDHSPASVRRSKAGMTSSWSFFPLRLLTGSKHRMLRGRRLRKR